MKAFVYKTQEPSFYFCMISWVYLNHFRQVIASNGFIIIVIDGIKKNISSSTVNLNVQWSEFNFIFKLNTLKWFK